MQDDQELGMVKDLRTLATCKIAPHCLRNKRQLPSCSTY